MNTAVEYVFLFLAIVGSYEIAHAEVSRLRRRTDVSDDQ